MQQQNKGFFKTIIICIIAAIALFAILSLTKKETVPPIAGGEMTLVGTSV